MEKVLKALKRNKTGARSSVTRFANKLEEMFKQEEKDFNKITGAFKQLELNIQELKL